MSIQRMIETIGTEGEEVIGFRAVIAIKEGKFLFRHLVGKGVFWLGNRGWGPGVEREMGTGLWRVVRM